MFKCVTCNRNIEGIEGSVIFKCPNCGAQIVRCGICRKSARPWKCPNCGFEGP